MKSNGPFAPTKKQLYGMKSKPTKTSLLFVIFLWFQTYSQGCLTTGWFKFNPLCRAPPISGFVVCSTNTHTNQAKLLG